MIYLELRRERFWNKQLLDGHHWVCALAVFHNNGNHFWYISPVNISPNREVINTLAAILTSGTCHELSVCCAPLQRVALVIYTATCVRSVALQTLNYSKSRHLKISTVFSAMFWATVWLILSSICEVGVSARSAKSVQHYPAVLSQMFCSHFLHLLQ